MKKLLTLKFIGLVCVLALAYCGWHCFNAGPYRVTGKFVASVPVTVVEVKTFEDLEAGKRIVRQEVQKNVAIYTEVVQTRSEAAKLAEQLRENGCFDVEVKREEP